MKWVKKQTGFTIVELLIVIVVIVILATIVGVAYSTVQKQALEVSLKSDLVRASEQLTLDSLKLKQFPDTLNDANGGKGIETSNGAYFLYRPNNTTNPKTFCLTAINDDSAFMIDESGPPEKGSCYNVALGASSPNALITNGITTTSPYYSGGSGAVSVTVNLGTVRDISSVKIWHYYGDGRTFYQTRTEVSADGTNWSTVFDSATSGTYQETSAGRTTTFPMKKVQFIRDWSNGSTSNTGNFWTEIQAY